MLSILCPWLDQAPACCSAYPTANPLVPVSPEPGSSGGGHNCAQIKAIRPTGRRELRSPPRQRTCCPHGTGLGIGTGATAKEGRGAPQPQWSPPSFLFPCSSSMPSPQNAAWLASATPTSVCQLCRAACAARDPSAAGCTCQGLCSGGLGKGGLPHRRNPLQN